MFKQLLGSKGRSRGFTLIELLVVVAIIALLISILLPSLARAREVSRRTACGVNLGGFGRGALTYAEANKGVLPVADHDPAISATGQPTSAAYVGARRMAKDRSTGANDGSNTRGWFKLMKGGAKAYIKGKMLICPSSKNLKHDPNGDRGDVLHPTTGATIPVFDFNGGYADMKQVTATADNTGTCVEMSTFSYSFQVTLRHSAGFFPGGSGTSPITSGEKVGMLLTNTMDPGKPMAADRNPYSNRVNARAAILPASLWQGGSGYYSFDTTKGVGELGGFLPPPIVLAKDQAGYRTFTTNLRKGKSFKDTSSNKTYSSNSRNHKQEGQNVAYLDGHAKWFNNPKAGVDEDCIWSSWAVNPSPAANAPDFFICDNTMPCDDQPPQDQRAYGYMRSRSKWATDAILFP